MAGYGMQGHLMLNFQNSFGTVKVDSLEALAITEESLTHNIEVLQKESMYSRFAQSPTHEGMHSVEGDITTEADPEGIGWLFRAFLDNYTAPSGDHLHQFLMATSDFDERAAGTPFTAEAYRDVGSAFLYYDLIGNTLDINIANGEIVNASLGVIGAGYSRQTASTPTFPSGQIPFNWSQTSASYDSAALLDVRELTVTANKNLEAVHTLQNTKAPYKIKRTGTELIELSGTILFQSHSYMIAFEDQEEKMLQVNFASNSPNALTLTFPKVKFKTYEVNMSGQGIIEANFTADALFDETSNYAFRIDLTNVRTLGYTA